MNKQTFKLMYQAFSGMANIISTLEDDRLPKFEDTGIKEVDEWMDAYYELMKKNNHLYKWLRSLPF